MKSFTRLLLVSWISIAAGVVHAGQDTLLASAARTATTSTVNQYRTTENAAHIIIVVTAAGTGTLTPSINAIDALGNSYILLTGTAITTTGTNVLKIGRAIGQVANAATQDLLPDIYNFTVTKSDSSSWTYSLTINRDP